MFERTFSSGKWEKDRNAEETSIWPSPGARWGQKFPITFKISARISMFRPSVSTYPEEGCLFLRSLGPQGFSSKSSGPRPKSRCQKTLTIIGVIEKWLESRGSKNIDMSYSSKNYRNRVTQLCISLGFWKKVVLIIIIILLFWQKFETVGKGLDWGQKRPGFKS